MVTKKRVELAESMVRSRRFAGLNLSSYRSVLDKEVEKQFAAIIFSLPELDYHQLVFRGTDIVSLAGRRIFSWPIVTACVLIPLPQISRWQPFSQVSLRRTFLKFAFTVTRTRQPRSIKVWKPSKPKILRRQSSMLPSNHDAFRFQTWPSWLTNKPQGLPFIGESKKRNLWRIKLIQPSAVAGKTYNQNSLARKKLKPVTKEWKNSFRKKE